ncbi:MAG TPA: GNAT family N-acetyltransferase [Phycisphaerae bacterium]|nr:GNAT family N-acetyltransferase [Phycisphaerae bacterium]HNU45140.1 GNAT family N-acetyltransferase [Phycisphaerae bacterium]
MNDTTQVTDDCAELRPFEPAQAGLVAGWVATDEELHWLAPSTLPPLTAEKVRAWRRPDGFPLLWWPKSGAGPIGYAELNPMRGAAFHYWLGHVVVRPQERGHGYGTRLVRAVLAWARDRASAERVVLIVFPGNTTALRCYARAGLHAVGEEFHRFLPQGPEQRLVRLEVSLSPGTVTKDAVLPSRHGAC